MHISKRSNGLYYVWFTDERGRKKKVSTGKSSKSEALKVFRNFTTPPIDVQQQRLLPTSLSSFTTHYLSYARGRYSRSYCENIVASLRALQRAIGDLPLRDIGLREVERFLAGIRNGKSDRTIRAYFVTLASSFQTAIRWEHIDAHEGQTVYRRELVRAVFPLPGKRSERS